MCQLIEDSATKFSANSLITALITMELFRVTADKKLIHTIANNLAAKVTQMPVKAVLVYQIKLEELKLPMQKSLSDEEKVNCEVKVQKLLKNGDVKLVDGLKYSVFLQLSSTLQNQIINDLLNFQDKWTKDDAREILNLLLRIESLEHCNFKSLVNPAIVKCTKFASYYPPSHLVAILRDMAELCWPH